MSCHNRPALTLHNITIAAPCNAAWENMQGDEFTRHCNLCDKTVHNLSSLSRAAAERFLSERGYDSCIRLYQRQDGTVMTRDCTYRQPSQAAMRHRSNWWMLGLACSLGLTASIAADLTQPAKNATTIQQPEAVDPSGMILMGAPVTPQQARPAANDGNLKMGKPLPLSSAAVPQDAGTSDKNGAPNSPNSASINTAPQGQQSTEQAQP